jgi:hypothetical protein
MYTPSYTGDGTADFDQTLRQTISKLTPDQLSKITFKYAINALPYHIASFKLSQAVKYTNDQKGPAVALQLLRGFLDNIENWD